MTSGGRNGTIPEAHDAPPPATSDLAEVLRRSGCED